MSYISVQFGYNQAKLFHINCQNAPLMDAINTGAYKEMVKTIKNRQEWFEKEIASFQKQSQVLEKKLDLLNNPKKEEKKDDKPGSRAPARRKTAKELAEEKEKKKLEAIEKAKKDEEERIRKEEEDRKKKEEEEAKAAAAKKGGAKKPAGKGKEVVEEVEAEPETEEERIAREKLEIAEQIKELKSIADAYQGKVKLCGKEIKKVEIEEAAEKFLDLKTRTDERKFMSQNNEGRADEILGAKKAYVLVKVKKNEADEEVMEDVVIDGACIRTPAQDLTWAVEQEELAALAAKGGKGKADPKKKK